MTAYRLNKELWVRPVPSGVQLYTPVDPKYPDQVNPYTSTQVIDEAGLVGLIGWWCEQHGGGTDQEMDDLIGEVVEAVYDRRMDCRCAKVAIRALVVCEVAQALAGWVEGPDEGEGLT